MTVGRDEFPDPAALQCWDSASAQKFYLAHLVRLWLNSPRPCLRVELLGATVLAQSRVY